MLKSFAARQVSRGRQVLIRVHDDDLLIEHEDLIVSNWTVRGTHTGTPFNGIAASGNGVGLDHQALLRLSPAERERIRWSECLPCDLDEGKAFNTVIAEFDPKSGRLN